MRRISRREALTLLGGAAMLGACRSGETPAPNASGSGSAPARTSAPEPGGAAGVTAEMFAGAARCAITPEQTEGPYYLDVDAIRPDIREDRQGAQLRVATRVVDTDGCTPVPGAVFEIWHCDAEGLYSGFEAASRGQGGGRADATRYLRGAQVTDADGIAAITTVYPGWYRGRTVHIHAKVALPGAGVLTTQLYFDDALTTRVFRSAPYAARGQRDTVNRDDPIFRQETMLTVREDGDGYLGLVTIGVA